MAPKKRKKGTEVKDGQAEGLHRYFAASKIAVLPLVDDSRNHGRQATDATVTNEIKLAPTPNQARVKNTVLACGAREEHGEVKDKMSTVPLPQPAQKKQCIEALRGKQLALSSPETLNAAIETTVLPFDECRSPRKKASTPLERRVSPSEFSHDGTVLRKPMQEPEGRFRSFGKVPWVQYDSLYAARLEKLRGRVLNQAQALWSSEVPVTRFLHKISASTRRGWSHEDIVVIGITFKDLKSRANLVEEYRKSKVCGSFSEEGVDIGSDLASESDAIWLEDQSSRIQLHLPAAQIGKLSSGLVIAVRGCVANCKFQVRSLCSAQARDALGMYEILHDGTWVNKGLSNDSQHVAPALAQNMCVNVVEIRSCLDVDRVRGRIEDPQGWISLVQPSTGYCWARKARDVFGVGLYEIIHEGTWINSGVANSSPHVANPLPKGVLVNVIEVRACRDVDRIRGRIENPQGWISLSRPSTGYTWAKKANVATAPRYPSLTCRSGRGPFVAFLSGLFVGAETEDVHARKRAMDFLLGKCMTEIQWHLSQAVQRVIICGGIYGKGQAKELPLGIADADAIFAELAENLLVDVMPGHTDPSNFNLPQMPLHPYFFRTARKRPKFSAVSNPYEITMDGLQILGDAGQAVHDLLRCTSLVTPMEALTLCLETHQLAPTAPDTLGMQPFTEHDPFVMEQLPQLLFSGGHKRAECEWLPSSALGSGTMCICVPAFNHCPAVVLVNLRDPRDVVVQEFGAAAHLAVVAR